MSNATNFDGVGLGPLPAVRAHVLRFASGIAIEVDETRHGGMGAVHLGRMRADDREIAVAVKVIRSDLLLDVHAQTAFRSEVSLWGQLSGIPFILPLLRVEKLDGQLHILTARVMPNESGVVSLRDRLRTEPQMNLAEVYQVAFSVATGMARANKTLRDFAHGDLKPENVLMLGGLAHIADFGIAKVLRTFLHHQPRGTPGYMAPEAAHQELSEKTDIYSFGRMIDECLGTCVLDNEPLHDLLAEIAEECSQQEPSERPDGFGWIAGKLLFFGVKLVPAELQRLLGYCQFCDQQLTSDDMRTSVETGRIQNLLEASDPQGALDVLSRIDERDRTAELWLLAGTAHSLAGDDEQALRCFDRCEAIAGADNEMLIRCASERGLSLKRLDRHGEAIEVYEQLISLPLGPMLVTVMANYTAALLESGQLEAARRRAVWLTDKSEGLAAAWTLRGQVERKSGRYTEALRSLRRSIELEPVSYLPHMCMGEILMEEYGDLKGALEHFDLAFATGEHSVALLTSLLSVNMLLGNRAEVAGLLDALSSAPKEAADAITARSLTQIEKFTEKFGGESTHAPSAKEENQEVEDCAAEDGTSLAKVMVMETAVVLGEDGKLPMMGCRAYLTSEFFAIDYFDAEVSGFSERFGQAFSRFTQDFILSVGKLHLRNSMLMCVRCEHCGFQVVTNRDECEQLLCRVCDRKGRVVPDRSPSARALVGRCEAAAQLERSTAAGNAVILSLWPLADDLEGVRDLCTHAGWQVIATDTATPMLASYLAQSRGATISAPPSLQVMLVLPPGEETYGGTPWSVQLLLMSLHPRFGRFPTGSIIIPMEQIHYLTSNSEAVLEAIGREVGASPESADDLATLISITMRNDLSAARRLVGLSFQISDNDNVRLHVARGLFYIKTNDLTLAERALRRAKALAPLDATPRLGLIQLWQAMGSTADEEKERSELHAIGTGSIMGRT